MRDARAAADTPAAGATCQTDGRRAVMVFDRRPVALSQIQFFDWERPAEHQPAQIDAAAAR